MISALIAFSVVTVCMGLQFCYAGTQVIGLAANGVTTDATVVRVDRFARDNKVTVEFSDQGSTVSAECSSCNDDAQVDDRLRIRYNPEGNLIRTVEDATKRGSSSLAIGSLAAIAVCMAGAAFVGWRLHRERRSG